MYLLDQSAGCPFDCQPACCLSVYHSLTYLPVCPPALHVCLSTSLPASLLVCFLCLLGCFSICLSSCMSLQFSCLSESHTVFLCVCLVYVSTRFVVRKIAQPESFAISLHFVKLLLQVHHHIKLTPFQYNTYSLKLIELW